MIPLFVNVDTDRYLYIMRNPEYTREEILRKSGLLFNTRGYKATSISNITDSTGFTKGAIYRHFKSKEELERETLFHLSTQMFGFLQKRIKAKSTAGEKIRSMFEFFESYATNPPLKGGCPLLNAAIEADDSHPVLRKAAVKVLNMLRASVIKLLDNGVRYKQIDPTADKEFYATIFIASLEGALMMSKLQGTNTDMKRVLTHLDELLQKIEI